MKNTWTILLSVLFLASSLLSFSQTPSGFECGLPGKLSSLVGRNPFIRQHMDELELLTQEFIRSGRGTQRSEPYIIPVVFHVIHMYGEENISDSQILDAMEILNEDFNGLNADIADVVPPFDEIATNVGIEFRLATKDPFGNCTNGIDRVASVETFVGDDGSKLNIWPRDRYLNIWVVADMEGGVAGYAYYPTAVASPELSWRDGIMIRHNYVGSVGTSNPDRSRALTHEVGHYLNLSHPWGSTNSPGVQCGDDFVDDTPVTKGWSTCNLAGSECEAGVLENVQNFMEYSYCSRMFTAGQRLRMIATLESPVGYRNNLWTSENLAITGVSDDSQSACVPQAGFFPSTHLVCVDEAVTFFDYSLFGTPDSWSWTFEDGSPSQSTEPNPQVTFISEGWKTVTLTVSGNGGTSSLTREAAIYVTPLWSELPGLLQEEFPNATDFSNTWRVFNLDQNETTWQQIDGYGYGDQQCVYLNVADVEPTVIDEGDNDLDELITPSMDLSNLSNGVFSFRYAFATAAVFEANMTDQLQLYTSKDCGETWVLRETITGLDLVTAGNFGVPFFPAENSQWRLFTYDIPSSLEDQGVRFKLRFTSSLFGNNLFIDDVNVSGTVGIPSSTKEAELPLYPNPVNTDEVFIPVSATASDRLVRLMDMTGREVLSLTLADNDRSSTISMDISDLPTGCYIVTYQDSSGSQSGRMIRQ